MHVLNKEGARGVLRMPERLTRQPLAWAALLLIGGVGACRDAQSTGPAAVARASVTGAAAEAIDAKGRFVLSALARGAGEIDAVRAKQLAAAMWHDNAKFLEATVSADRGAPVHASDLVPCERAYYARTAYESIPATAQPALRKSAGSHWLVGLCADGVEEVVVAVSANATDTQLSTGRVQLIQPGDGNFFAMGVPVGTTIPFEPEVVVDAVAGRMKKRIAQVPELVMRPIPNSPTTALWQVTMEEPVAVRGNRSTMARSRTTLFAGAANGWLHPAMADARATSADNGSDAVDNTDARGKNTVRISLRRRVGIPAAAELVDREVQ